MRLVYDDDMIETLRRIEPITRSTYGFYQGLADADTTSAMPMPAKRRWKVAPQMR